MIALTLIGAVNQRIAGLGFAMLVSPFLALILGPATGVLVMNVLAVTSSLIVLTRVHSAVDWSLFAWLTPAALVAVPVGAFFTARGEEAILFVAIGFISITAIVVSLVVRHLEAHLSGPSALALTGAAAGLTNSIAGIAGPTLTAYAILSDWPHRSFVATIQPLLALMGTAAVVTKLFIFPIPTPDWGWWMWAAIISALVSGVALGERIDRKLRPHIVRRWLIVVALAGATTALIRGVILLAAR